MALRHCPTRQTKLLFTSTPPQSRCLRSLPHESLDGVLLCLSKMTMALWHCPTRKTKLLFTPMPHQGRCLRCLPHQSLERVFLCLSKMTMALWHCPTRKTKLLFTRTPPQSRCLRFLPHQSLEAGQRSWSMRMSPSSRTESLSPPPIKFWPSTRMGPPKTGYI